MDASEDMLAAVLTQLPSEVAVLDGEANIVYTNRAWQQFDAENRLAGDPTSRGQNYLDACDASADTESACDVADGIRSLLAGDADEFSMEYPCHSEERRYFSMTARRFRHAGHDHVLLVHADVTDRRTAEERVRTQNDRLKRVAGILSHDLRNPLEVAVGYAEMLAADTDGVESESDGDGDRPSRDEMVARVRAALDRMSAIVDGTLTLARRTGVDKVKTERVDLRTAAERAWANVRSDDATLDVRDTFAFEADASLLDTLFENLFRNSVEHGSTDNSTQSDGVAVRVRVGTLDGGDGFYVEDDGLGLPSERRGEVFEAGFTTGDGAENTGLGLAIVASIAETHGWLVDATDGADGGARFEVRV